jgi:hypothetical protein
VHGRWNPGDSVLWRSVVNGVVRWAIPHTFIEESAAHVVLYVAPGTTGLRPKTSLLDDLAQLRTGRVEHEDHVWRTHNVLRLTPPQRDHSVNLFWTEDWEFRGWYVNLQAPLERTRLGFDTRDHALDVTVDPEGRWAWKDEDHLERLVQAGAYTREAATAIRAEGVRVIAEWPFPTGWEDWRPDLSWASPSLPDGWNQP